MKVTFNRNELTESVEARNALVRIMSDAKHGGFMRIHGFESKTGHGEIQNTTYQKGISYPEAVKRSLSMLETIEADTAYEATVTRGVWLDKDGKANPTGRKSKVYTISKTVTETYKVGSPEMTEALAKVRKSLTAPERPSKEYKKLGNGVYEDEATGTLYIRDLRLISKVVVVHGQYPFKASKAVTAISDAIKRGMPISKYRMFRMDANFDKVSLGGIEVAPEGVANEAITAA
jgi:hypothetical protein